MKKKIEQRNEEIIEKEIVASVVEDFNQRREERRKIELNWLLGINFLLGNQYSTISTKGEIVDEVKSFAWESREVFNHIAPIVESRLAKLGRVRPSMNVRPTGSEENDIQVARLSRAVLNSVSSEIGLSEIVSEATVWSEVCGTVFYKVFWDKSAGQLIFDGKNNHEFSDENNAKNSKKSAKNIQNSAFSSLSAENTPEISYLSSIAGEQETAGKKNTAGAAKSLGGTSEAISVGGVASGASSDSNRKFFAGGLDSEAAVFDQSLSENAKKILDGFEGKLFAGDVKVQVVSPFEIFPDSATCANLDEVESLIHAYIVSAARAEEVFGMPFAGSDIDVLSFDLSGFDGFSAGASNIKRHASNVKHDQILVLEKYTRPSAEFPSGRLIIVAGDRLVFDGESDFPFVRQVSNDCLNSFWGTSIIDRCIPIQRAYNAVKNRKYEYLARLSAGVLAVEDGSVDIDNLEEEGLSPGKILVYRAGSTIPRFMDAGDIPNEFAQEEDRLLNEFITLTGVSELMRNSSVPGSVSSGTAINLLIEQDDTRLSVSAENIRKSMLNLSKKILLLYKRFASLPKLSKVVDEHGDIEIFYWTGSDISADDVVLDTANELAESPSMRKNMVLELLKNGLLADENGKISSRMRAKVLESLGFGNWESSQDILTLHIKRANRENLGFEEPMVLEIDDHAVHIDEHTKFLLSDEGNKIGQSGRNKIISHIREHKMFGKINKSSSSEDDL